MSDGTCVMRVHLVPLVDLETGQIVEIDRDDITKITSDKYGIVFTSHESGKRYRFPRNQDEIEEAWFQYGFRSTDSTNVVNVNRAKVYDEARGLLYFGDSEESDFAYVAAVHNDHVIALSIQRGIKVIPSGIRSRYNKVKERLTRRSE
ncbi:MULTISPECIES: hypothetical protein [Paenibacillus]|uniref:Uncharacterized protein n=1 Tax=Paenibacillus ehimensis TaxID=79264 RepID=A0ABT8VI51_9BACL|nr:MULTISPECIES: hypothetical protein [Paenibacillus]MCP1306454.1 hypothetical protein [Paenibacillus tyrfis]MDO3680665.1 hypothetical protein [Paenibacillus ehimensis]